MGKFSMKLNLNVLNHLGINLYSNVPAVLSEAVANAYDADATEVKISCSQDQDEIIIEDNGIGMTLEDINKKFLCVGYQKRKNGEAFSKIYNRPVMGRKGIGKLSLLSIADEISVHTKKDGDKNALKISRFDIENEINSDDENANYNPKEISFNDFTANSGTKIILKKLRKNISRTPEFLKKRLARRFGFKADDFKIYINSEEITIKDRDYFSKLEFVWPIGDFDTDILSKFDNLKIQEKLNDKINIDGAEYKIQGWIGTFTNSGELKDDNKISILCRNKLAQEDILTSFKESGLYATYLIGEIYADFLDLDEMEDIATSSRQQLQEDDPRYQKLQSYIYEYILKPIQRKWTALRNDNATKKIINSNPAVKTWFNNLGTDSKKYAKKILSTIENLPIDEKNNGKKKQLLKYGILAFERLKISDQLSIIDETDSILAFGKLFDQVQDLEATLYYDIASERMKVIRRLSQLCDDNEKEKVIQEHIFDHLWLLNPSWERAASGSERLEQSVTREFKSVTDTLTEDEKKGRIDIRYKTTAGKHLIIELKRYEPSYEINIYTLAEQVGKYKSALEKCLKDIGKENEKIECVCIVGKSKKVLGNATIDKANKLLNTEDARILFYDQLIEDALESYKDYLEKEKEVGEIRKLIEQL